MSDQSPSANVASAVRPIGPASVIGFLCGVAVVVYLVRPMGGYNQRFFTTVSAHFLDQWSSYLWAAGLSGTVIVVGTLIGFVFGFGLAVLVYRVPQARSFATPVIAFLAPMPIVIWIPFSIGLVGVGMVQVLLIVVLGALFTFYLYCLEALHDIPRSVRDVFDIHGGSRIMHLYLPRCIESVSSIYRVYLAFAWVAVIISEVGRDEQSGAWTGLGYKFYYAYSLIQSHGLIIALVTLIASAYILDRLFYFTFKYFNRWKVERP